MKLEKIFHAIHWFLFIFNLFNFLIFIFEIKYNLFWLNLSLIVRMTQMSVSSIPPCKNISIFRKSNWKSFWDFNISYRSLIIKLIFQLLINLGFKLNFLRSKLEIVHLRISQIEVIRPSPRIKLVLLWDLEILLISMKFFNEFLLIIVNLESKEINRSHSINICLIQKFIYNFLGLSPLLHTSCLYIFQLLRAYGELLLNYSKNAKD